VVRGSFRLGPQPDLNQAADGPGVTYVGFPGPFVDPRQTAEGRGARPSRSFREDETGTIPIGSRLQVGPKTRAIHAEPPAQQLLVGRRDRPDLECSGGRRSGGGCPRRGECRRMGSLERAMRRSGGQGRLTAAMETIELPTSVRSKFTAQLATSSE
jgi:hypothetical protein